MIQKKHLLLLILILGIMMIGCKGTTSTIDSESENPTLPLRALAEQHDLLIGTALSTEAFSKDESYGEVLAQEFNMVTPENAFKMKHLQPTQGVYDFKAMDALVDFAHQHDLGIRGHVLVYHNAIPSWMEDKGTTEWTRDEMITILEDHVNTMVTRYTGDITYWEAVNEGFDEEGNVKNKFFTQTIGEDYVYLPFTWIKEADPNALVFYNENGIVFSEAKQHAVYDFVKTLHEQELIDGIGIQLHISIEEARTIGFDNALKEVENTFKRFNDLGLDVHVTELDVRIKEPATSKDLQDQALIYERVLDLCLSASQCNSFTMWGFTDKYSWIPSFQPGYGSALILDEDYEPKPAYHALSKRLAEKPKVY